MPVRAAARNSRTVVGVTNGTRRHREHGLGRLGLARGVSLRHGVDPGHGVVGEPALGVDTVAEPGDLEQPLDLGNAAVRGRPRPAAGSSWCRCRRRRPRPSSTHDPPQREQHRGDAADRGGERLQAGERVLESLDRNLHLGILAFSSAVPSRSFPAPGPRARPSGPGAWPAARARAETCAGRPERVPEASADKHRPHDHHHQEHGLISGHLLKSSFAAGWSSLVARRAHNPKVAGSNPAPATLEKPRKSGALFCGTNAGHPSAHASAWNQPS